MTRLAYSVVLCLPFLGLSAPGEPVWLTRYGTALEQAEREKRPLLIDFDATWCKHCKRMATGPMQEADVVAALAPYVTARIDFDQNKAVAMKIQQTMKWKTFPLPMLVIAA